MESLVVWLLTGAAAWALLWRSRAPSTIALVAALLVGTAAGHGLWAARDAGRQRSADELAARLPQPVSLDGYVTSDSCRACHPSEYASWHRSYHRTMTQAASAATVRAPFAGETLLGADGHRYRLRREKDELWVDISDIGAKRIGMMTGSHHMQAYWLSGERGNEQIEFPFTYLFDDQRWVSRREVFLVGDEYSKNPAVWNRICIECHVTRGRPGFDPQLEVPKSQVAELGIACESCHGPAADHVAQNRRPWRRWALHASGAADATIVNPARLPNARMSEVCGQCHGIGCPPDDWMQNGIGYQPGTDLSQVKTILRISNMRKNSCAKQIEADSSFVPSRYWSDGMARVSGREYNGLIESPCYQGAALTCLSCHSMHDSDPDGQLIFARDSNDACLQCHKNIDEGHSHHRAGSPGALCYNCHMPHTTWGLLRAMRSHQISVPRVKDTLDTGRPNACNLCHLDRTLGWTAESLHRWYGAPQPSLTDEQGRVAASVLDLLRGEAGVRAITAWSMGWSAARAASGSDWMVPFLIELLDDDYAAVRYVAYRSLRQMTGFGDFKYDYVGSQESRWAAQKVARERMAPAKENRRELLYGPRGFERGELERLLAGRAEDDQMFLAE